jgi:hypothetical protein
MQETKCSNCNSKNTIKVGKRKNKQKEIQRYKCKQCNKTFIAEQIKHKTYPTKIILNVISYYNLGHTQIETSNLINQRFKTNVPQRTISEWLKQYKEICTFNKLRDKATKLYTSKDIIFSEKLDHQQVYLFRYHKAKLEILFKDIKYNNQFRNSSKYYEPIKNYLEKIPTQKFPHHIFKSYETKLKEGIIKQESLGPNAEIEKNNNLALNNNKNNNATYSLSFIASNQRFETSASGQSIINFQGPEAVIAKLNNKDNENKNILEQRISQLKIKTLPTIKLSKNNTANKITNLALSLAKTNKQRHESIQNFMLINDSTTIAVELPVYLTNDDIVYFRKRGFILEFNNYKTPITGHIDILQIRNGLIHILDYKPDADKTEAVQQLTLYALALASRTKLALKDFKAAWFDENNYYEFFPLHAVYPKKEKFRY